MKLTRATIRRVAIGLGIVVAMNLIVLGLFFRDVLHDQQGFFNDHLMLQAAGKLNLGSIAIAAIDDSSLKAYGRLESWDRKHFADLIRQLKKNGAQAVAFDVVFPDASPSDDDLAQAIDQAMRPTDGTAPMPVIMAVSGDGQPVRVPDKGLQFDSFQAMTPNVAKGKPILAAVNVDPDGTYVRNLPMLYFAGQEQYEPLPLIAASAFAARLPGFTGDFVLEDQPYRLGFGCKTNPNNPDEPQCVYQIPTDQYFRMPIYFFSRPDGYHPNAISLYKIAEGQVPPELIRGRLFFVGAYEATGLADDYPVPTSENSKMDGVEIWANAAQSLIEGKFITPEPWPSTFGFMLGLSLLAAVVLLRFTALGWAVTIAGGALYTILRYIFTSSHLLAPSVIGHQQTVEMPNFAYVDAALILSSGALFVFLFIAEQRRRGAVYSTFGRFVTPAVAQQIASQQASGTLNLGGSRRVATIMFGNLYPPHGVDADEMLPLLNGYWEGIVRIVSEHGGNVNKFIGDHIMVMFNVPLDLEDHAAAACRAAYEAVEWVKERRSTLPPEQQATFGVGLNTGPLVAGNMGSGDRLEFTVLGDTVNTSSRLSGVAKEDEVIISKATVELLDGSGAKLEDRGEVRVKGKAEPVKVYAILGFGDPGPVQIVQPVSLAAG
ncbi:MAG TPA: adenylate/guanylate cyclase domain-containing protein [Chloroflexota bacterium]|nr:adenylate/guanylate cyclase domain-containing protein [Chloroflexota bacterium]